jgi:CRP-like cAMP-binding protein
MHNKILEYIAQYISLTAQEQEYFLSLLKHRKVLKRQFLLQAGDICRFENFVIKGCLRSYYIDDEGLEHVVQFSVENWWTSDLSSFLTGKEANLSIEALEETEVLQIEKPLLEELYIKVPAFNRLFRVLLQNAFVAHQDRMIQRMSMDAAQRYLLFIKKYPNLEQRIPQHQIASYLDITPESLSRIRKQLAS